MRYRAISWWVTLTLGVFWATPATSLVTIDWVTVGDPGNACDTQSQGCFGSVAEVYRISKYEVTDAQYSWIGARGRKGLLSAPRTALPPGAAPQLKEIR